MFDDNMTDGTRLVKTRQASIQPTRLDNHEYATTSLESRREYQMLHYSGNVGGKSHDWNMQGTQRIYLQHMFAA
jgi:hypothetical protein